MSKSRGNIVRAETVHEVLGADALRYFLLREIPFGQDGNFSFDALVQRYNGDLANGYGNLVSRTLAMITRYFDGVVPGGVRLSACSRSRREHRPASSADTWTRSISPERSKPSGTSSAQSMAT